MLIEKLKMLNEIRSKIDPTYRFIMNVVITRSNYFQIETFIEFAKEYNFNIVNYFLVSKNRNNENIFNYNRNDEILSRVSKALDSARESCEKYGITFNTNITKDLLHDNVVETHEKINNKQSADTKDNIPNKVKMCRVPWKTLSINALGEVIPTTGCFCRNVMGNLNTESLDEIWNGEPMVKYREQIVSGDIDKVCTLKQVYKEIPFELLK